MKKDGNQAYIESTRHGSFLFDFWLPFVGELKVLT